MLPCMLLALPLLATAVAAGHQTTVTLQIASSSALPNPWALAANTHATLSSAASPAEAVALLTPANTLVFRNVTPGSYLLDLHCSSHLFAPLRLDVPAAPDDPPRAWETFRGNAWDNRGEAVALVELAGGGSAFQVRAVAPKTYFIDRPSFSVFSVLRNPMILVGLVSIALFMGMPYLMQNMDPEMRAEIEQRQKENPVSNLLTGGTATGSSGAGFDIASFSSFLAGSSKPKSPSAAPAAALPQSQSHGGGVGGRKKEKGAKR